MSAPNAISVGQLSKLVGTPSAPIIVDVCIDEDFTLDPYLIPGAFRHDFRDLAGLRARLRDAPIVVICQKGLKLSQGVASWLRCEGFRAEYLAGGMLAWRDAGALRLRHAAIPAVDPEGRTLWVTRHRPKIDRIACPWLIRRFVDPSARFLFVAPDQVADVAARLDATPFDVRGVPLSHRDGLCSFEVMLAAFDLTSEPLSHLGRIIRAADTGELDAEPQAAGLLAASLGLSRIYRDDDEQVEAGMLLYDAFYRWCRDAVEETHIWEEDGGAA